MEAITTAPQAPGRVPTSRRVYDLSLPFDNDMPTFHFYKNEFQPPLFSIFRHPAFSPPEDGFVTHVSFITHIGTHVDAPRHFREDGQTVDQVPPDRWLGEGPVMAIPKDALGEVTAADLEATGMEVRPGDIVAINTGWHHRYVGPGVDREGAIEYMERGPGLCAESAAWLVERGVVTVMIDAPAIDSAVHMPYGDGTLESHRTLFAQNIPAVEGLGGELDAVSGRRCLLSCAPVRYKGGDAFPLRALAIPLD
jgi:kynurenine formamidase